MIPKGNYLFEWTGEESIFRKRELVRRGNHAKARLFDGPNRSENTTGMQSYRGRYKFHTENQ